MTHDEAISFLLMHLIIVDGYIADEEVKTLIDIVQTEQSIPFDEPEKCEELFWRVCNEFLKDENWEAYATPAKEALVVLSREDKEKVLEAAAKIAESYEGIVESEQADLMRIAALLGLPLDAAKKYF